MSKTFRRPFQMIDYAQLMRTHVPAPEYFESDYLIGPEEIEKRQLERLKRKLAAAHQVPFYRKRWEAAGVHPDEIKRLADLSRLPAYRVDDIRKSIEANPPLGDYQGVSPADAAQNPMRVYMSGATTGAARPTLYTTWDRQAGAILTARALYAQGIRPGDTVINAWAYSTHNGAFSMDEALYDWLSCVVLTTGTGNVTSSRRQVELARQYKATAILTTGDYLLHLADVARQMGLDPKKDFNIRALPNVGDREKLEETFGVPCYMSYGFHEVQWVAIECPAKKGCHVFEDAFIIEVVDKETGELVPDGTLGSLCVTEIYKTGSSQIRYNIQDLSALYPRERCECGSWLRRIAPFAGRADNMVKLRGVNIWPEAIGEVALQDHRLENEYFVRAVREGERDEMIAHVTTKADPSAYEELARTTEARLKERFGVKLKVEVSGPDSLDHWTEIKTSPKPKRFKDER